MYCLRVCAYTNTRIYMLFTGWEVRIVKNCERGLENAALAYAYINTRICVYQYAYMRISIRVYAYINTRIRVLG